MFNKDLIIKAINNIGWSKYKLCKEANLSQSTLSDILTGKNKNPRMDTIQKIATALNVSVDTFFDNAEEFDKSINVKQLKEESELYETGEFKTPEAAMQFILKQPAIMGFGGFNPKELSNEDIISFANDLLEQYKNLSYKYKCKDK